MPVLSLVTGKHGRAIIIMIIIIKIYSQILKHESTFINEKETQHVNRCML